MSECFVYVIAADLAVGPVKIGIAANPEARLRDLQTGHYRKLILTSTYKCPNRHIAAHIERCFHEVQRTHRLRGEWFDMEPDKALILLTFALGVAMDVNTEFNSDEINEIIRSSRRQLAGVHMLEEAA